MTQEEKQLLIKDLCVRLPYGVICEDVYGNSGLLFDLIPDLNAITLKISKLGSTWTTDIDKVKPYLRPLTSMTEEEMEEYRSLSDEVICTYGPYNTECKFHCVRLGIKPDNPHECIDDYLSMDAIDWLNAHHFDYRGLIEKGLALEAPEEMYN